MKFNISCMPYIQFDFFFTISLHLDVYIHQILLQSIQFGHVQMITILIDVHYQIVSIIYKAAISMKFI